MERWVEGRRKCNPGFHPPNASGLSSVQKRVREMIKNDRGIGSQLGKIKKEATGLEGRVSGDHITSKIVQRLCLTSHIWTTTHRLYIVAKCGLSVKPGEPLLTPDRVGRRGPWFFERVGSGRDSPGHGVRSYFHPASTQPAFER